MLIDSLTAILPLAATEPGFLGSLLTNLFLLARVALGIGLVIFVHELGHFVAAKSFGVKCEKFYVGFDVPIKIGPIKFPRTLGKFRYGETEYGIGIIPLGGYVKMLGQDDDPRKLEEENQRIQVDNDHSEQPVLDPRSFPAKPVWQRMIIISAGVVMNVITGVLFAAMAFGVGVSYTPAIISGVTPGGPAWQAGLQPGGKVVAIGRRQNDDDMHFRKMQQEILTQGLDSPQTPIDVVIRYDDGDRKVKLRSVANPENRDMKMIGVMVPSSLTLDKKYYAAPESAAAKVLTDKDAGATIVAFDGIEINPQSIVPGTPFLDYVYSNPSKAIRLRLRRSDGSEHDVTLPPQKTKSIGFRYAIGPVVALIDDGPAAKAGMKVGDVIKAVGENQSPDAYGMASDLIRTMDPVKFTVLRGEGDAAKEVELQITPVKSLQTVAPTQSILGEMAINSFGFAYRPLTVVADVINRSESEDTTAEQILPGDQLQEVALETKVEDLPQWLQNKRYALAIKALRKGVEFSPATPLNTFQETIQKLPVGTEIRVSATRPPEDRVVSTTVKITEEDLPAFDRGLGFAPSLSIQKASSPSEALALGHEEGMQQFSEVLRFLKMLTRGRVKLRHVGGPLAIFDIAMSEAEKGFADQLLFLTMLSMNLAILNFLPIPALDGGHMMFLLYELIRGKRANEQLEFRLTIAGLLSLLALMVVVFASDILRYLN